MKAKITTTDITNWVGHHHTRSSLNELLPGEEAEPVEPPSEITSKLLQTGELDELTRAFRRLADLSKVDKLPSWCDVDVLTALDDDQKERVAIAASRAGQRPVINELAKEDYNVFRDRTSRVDTHNHRSSVPGIKDRDVAGRSLFEGLYCEQPEIVEHWLTDDYHVRITDPESCDVLRSAMELIGPDIDYDDFYIRHELGSTAHETRQTARTICYERSDHLVFLLFRNYMPQPFQLSEVHYDGLDEEAFSNRSVSQWEFSLMLKQLRDPAYLSVPAVSDIQPYSLSDIRTAQEDHKHVIPALFQADRTKNERIARFVRTHTTLDGAQARGSIAPGQGY